MNPHTSSAVVQAAWSGGMSSVDDDVDRGQRQLQRLLPHATMTYDKRSKIATVALRKVVSVPPVLNVQEATITLNMTATIRVKMQTAIDWAIDNGPPQGSAGVGGTAEMPLSSAVYAVANRWLEMLRANATNRSFAEDIAIIASRFAALEVDEFSFRAYREPEHAASATIFFEPECNATGAVLAPNGSIFHWNQHDISQTTIDERHAVLPTGVGLSECHGYLSRATLSRVAVGSARPPHVKSLQQVLRYNGAICQEAKGVSGAGSDDSLVATLFETVACSCLAEDAAMDALYLERVVFPLAIQFGVLLAGPRFQGVLFWLGIFSASLCDCAETLGCSRILRSLPYPNVWRSLQLATAAFEVGGQAAKAQAMRTTFLRFTFVHEGSACADPSMVVSPSQAAVAECVICREKAPAGLVVRCRRCGHGGHAHHLAAWRERGHVHCPLCTQCECVYASPGSSL